MTGANRWLILVGAAAAVVILFFVFRGGDDDATDTTAATTTTATTTATSATTTEPEPDPGTTEATTTTPPPPRLTRVNVTVRGGTVVGGPKVHEVPLGKRVVLVVRSNVADHVHVHGYDLMKDIGPGTTARFSFVARLSGRFEFELEDRHLRLGELSVAPS